MATEKTQEVMQDIAVAIGDAEAQLPTARELVRLMRDAGEDTTEVQALVTEIQARITQWRRVLDRQGVVVKPPPSPETE